MLARPPPGRGGGRLPESTMSRCALPVQYCVCFCSGSSASMAETTSGWLSPKYSGPAMAVLGGGGSAWPSRRRASISSLIRRRICAGGDNTARATLSTGETSQPTRVVTGLQGCSWAGSDVTCWRVCAQNECHVRRQAGSKESGSEKQSGTCKCVARLRGKSPVTLTCPSDKSQPLLHACVIADWLHLLRWLSHIPARSADARPMRCDRLTPDQHPVQLLATIGSSGRSSAVTRNVGSGHISPPASSPSTSHSCTHSASRLTDERNSRRDLKPAMKM
eukprot:211054-Chlamydomonas_euryale.AAC.1